MMKRLFAIVLLVILSGCAKSPPNNIDNICSIFRQYPEWYRETADVERRWHIPISVQMAIIHQESKFDSQAQPERTKLLWVIPWTRPSSAYGYTQALKTTWERYRRERGGFFAMRDDFGDGVDFIGWYATQAYKRAGIPRNNAYALYLAYHEGVGGYMRKTYLKKSWLINVAHKVSARSKRYQMQLLSCDKSLKKRWNVWRL